MRKPIEDLTGRMFGRLKVLERVENGPDGRTRWKCECQCEDKTILIVPAKNLRNGNTKSCGCIKREKLAARNSTHGYHSDPLYLPWKEYRRNKRLVQEWEDFKTYKEYIIGLGYNGKDHVSIRRIDSSKPLGPGNAKFLYTEKRSGIAVYNLGEDLTGRTFGKLYVLGYGVSMRRRDGQSYRTWLCECQCENKTILLVPTDKLLSGKKTDCGCEYTRRIRNNEYMRGPVQEILNECKTFTDLSRERRHDVYIRLFGIYKMMHDRCENVDSPKYHLYGGRGISVCEEWSDPTVGFARFLKWALENGYGDELSIDRLDSDSGYYPENCHWVSIEFQGSNTKRNRYIFDGASWLTFSQFERNNKLPSGKLKNWLAAGWTIDAIVHHTTIEPIRLDHGAFLDEDGFIVLIHKSAENSYPEEIKRQRYLEANADKGEG